MCKSNVSDLKIDNNGKCDEKKKSFVGPVDEELVNGSEAIYHTLCPRNVTLKTFPHNIVI